MHSYAQTNIQLFNQLHREGYRAADLEAVVSAHELMIELMTGQFRASGKTFIAHLVGTASILGSLHAAPALVAAALLHAAYSAGDFGDDRLGVSDAKRARVRSAVGEQVEDYVCRYHNLPWDDQTIGTVSDGLDRMAAIERDVVLMRLANELEDFLDLGILYCGEQKRSWTSGSRRCQVIIGMARSLGFRGLADELQRTIDEAATAVVPREFLRQNARNASFLLMPQSCQRLKSFLATRLASLERAPQSRPNEH
jgi:(p)ppGpp synthase/HD superfamily hydrolase